MKNKKHPMLGIHRYKTFYEAARIECKKVQSGDRLSCMLRVWLQCTVCDKLQGQRTSPDHRTEQCCGGLNLSGLKGGD